MKELFVYYELDKVGVFRQDEDLLHSFQYDESWLVNPRKFPISLAMPLQRESYGNKLTLSYFENLLPEGDLLDRIQSTQRVGGPFDFLAHYGADCAGAMSIREPGHPPKSVKAGKIEKIDIQKIYDAIDAKQSVASVLAEENVYLSLAGAQDKFAAIVREDGLYLPLEGTATTHIVKVPILHSGIKDSVHNEHFCLELAKRVELPVANSHILEGPHPLLLIERYDRVIDEQQIVYRLHQQDLCQAQGYISENKYENKGGLSLQKNYEFLKDVIPVKQRLGSLELFLKWISFNLLIGNHDSHSKNISLLLTPKGQEIAPFYDLFMTTIYPRLTSHFSFNIGDRDKFSEIGKNQIELQETRLGIKKNVLLTHIKEMNRRIEESKTSLIQEMQSKYPGITVFERIDEELRTRKKSLIRQGVELDSGAS